MADFKQGDSLPELRVTPDAGLTKRYARGVGRSEPDPHGPGVREVGRAPGRHPPRPLLDGAGRACPHRGRRRRPASPEAALGPVPRHGLPRAGDRGHARRVKEASNGRVVTDTGRRSGRQPDHPQRRGGARARLKPPAPVGSLRRPMAVPTAPLAVLRAASPTQLTARLPAGERQPPSQAHPWLAPRIGGSMLSERQAADPQPGRRLLPRVRQAGGLEVARRARRTSSGAPRPCAPSSRSSSVPAISPTRTPRRADCPTDAGYRFYADSLLASGLPARRRRPAAASTRRRCAARSTRRCARRRPSSPGSPTCSPSRPRRPPSTARIHRVEVLLLQPRVVMVVVIASNGAVTKRVFTFSRRPSTPAWSSGRRAT